jgi:O-antigen/teichoic acid export membrane protein
LPATEITHVISQVTFPAYSTIKDDNNRLKEAYLKVLQLTTFTSIPLAAGIFILAPEFTRIFLGDKWMPMVPAMQILSIFGATRALNATTGSIFLSTGKPSVLTKVSFIQLVFLAIIIYPFTSKAELVGVCWAVTLANLLCFVLAFREIIKILHPSKRNLANAVYPSIMATLSIVGLVHVFSIITDGKISAPVTFVLSILIGLLIYSIFAKILGFSFAGFFSTGTLFKAPPEFQS